MALPPPPPPSIFQDEDPPRTRRAALLKALNIISRETHQRLRAAQVGEREEDGREGAREHAEERKSDLIHSEPI